MENSIAGLENVTDIVRYAYDPQSGPCMLVNPRLARTLGGQKALKVIRDAISEGRKMKGFYEVFGTRVTLVNSARGD